MMVSFISCVATQPASDLRQTEAPLPSIAVKNLHVLIDSDSTALVLDVRTPEEYNGPLGHIEGALLIPVKELEQRMHEIPEYQNQKIYVICRSGGRSSRATRMLLETGHDATNVEGGMQAWNEMNDNVKGQVD
jgi:rhodanese-related sulfurtransferase